MKLLNISHKSIEYEFRLLERTRVIQIIKANVLAYEMRWSVSLFVCSCPGSKFHSKCWHTDMVAPLKQMPSVTEPWAEWAEEAEVMKGEQNVY